MPDAESAVRPDLVHHEQVGTLAEGLGAPVVQDVARRVAGLGGEADDDLTRTQPFTGQLGQHVRVLGQLDRRRAGVGLLDLVHARRAGPEVGHRRGHHDDIGTGGSRPDRGPQLGCALHRHDSHSVRRCDGEVGRDQHHVGPAAPGGSRQRDPLSARRSVAEEADRIDRLTGAAGRDHNSPSGQVLRHDEGQRARCDRRRLRQPTRPGVRTGEAPDVGLQDVHSSPTQGGDVGAGRWVLPHLGVHRGHQQDRAARDQQGRGQQVVGAPRGSAGQQIGGRRRHHHQVGGLAEPDVLDRGDVVEHPGGHRVTGQRLPGGTPDELQGRPGGHHPHVVPCLGEQPQQAGRLVGGDAPADTEQDAHGRWVSRRWAGWSAGRR